MEKYHLCDVLRSVPFHPECQKLHLCYFLHLLTCMFAYWLSIPLTASKVLDTWLKSAVFENKSDSALS